MQGLPRPLVTLLSSQLHSARSCAAPAARSALPSSSTPTLSRAQPGFQSVRGVATESLQDRVNALQERQRKMAEKAGRMKQMPGVMAAIPVFANHIRPKGTRTIPPEVKFMSKDWRQYKKSDWGNDVYTLFFRKWTFTKALSKDWEAKFTARTKDAYIALNQATATGNFTNLTPLASGAVIDSVKAQRSRLAAGLQMSWQLHGAVEQEILCIRQQEISKTDEFVAQIAVRFTADQSLELKNSRGNIVGKGNHDSPKRVTEYYVFQREMWRPDDNWRMVKRVQESNPLDPLAGMMA